jgi:predicted transcriptional regulator
MAQGGEASMPVPIPSSPRRRLEAACLERGTIHDTILVMMDALLNEPDDEAERAAFLAAVAEGRASVDRGDTVPHEVVSRWLKDFANGLNPPVPQRRSLTVKI